MTDAKTSVGRSGPLRISQCFYATAEPNKSVSLAIAYPDPEAVVKRTVKEFWHETFDRYADAADDEKEHGAPKKERDADEPRKPSKNDEEEKEHAEPVKRGQTGERKGSESEQEKEREKNPPRPVDGLGDAAFWMNDPVGGVLYVLKGEKFIRVSVGGPDKPDVKFNKSKALAEKALTRL